MKFLKMLVLTLVLLPALNYADSVTPNSQTITVNVQSQLLDGAWVVGPYNAKNYMAAHKGDVLAHEYAAKGDWANVELYSPLTYVKAWAHLKVARAQKVKSWNSDVEGLKMARRLYEEASVMGFNATNVKDPRGQEDTDKSIDNGNNIIDQANDSIKAINNRIIELTNQ